MLIIGQDKDRLVNFNNVNDINTCPDGNKGFKINVNYKNGDWNVIGIYKTEERAKEVLKDFFKQTTVNDYIKKEYASKKDIDYFKLSVVLNNLCYEMPKE